MKKYLILCAVGFLTLGAFTASYAEPLRKCNFYEIMNDDDEDGLVQNPKDGPSVCYYTQKDLSSAKKKAKKHTAASKADALSNVTTTESANPVTDSKSKKPIKPSKPFLIGGWSA